MEPKSVSKIYTLNKTTYINLRWIAILGQFLTVNLVKYVFNFEFDILICATGFDAMTGTLINMNIEGANGAQAKLIEYLQDQLKEMEEKLKHCCDCNKKVARADDDEASISFSSKDFPNIELN